MPAWLPQRTLRLIDRTVQILVASLKQDLAAAILVGAAMNPARHDRARAPEIVAFTSDTVLEDLAALARPLSEVMSAGVRVRLLTRGELRGSCDVFALEIAEWQARHQRLHGEDLLAGLVVTPRHLRHALETELRGLSRRIRNRVLAGLATETRDDPRQAVLDGIDCLVVASHHGLSLLGQAPPAEEAELLRAFAARAGADAEPLLRHLAAVRQGATSFAPAAVLAALLQVVHPATELIDKLELEVPA